MNIRTTIAATAALAAGLSLAACSSDEDNTASSTSATSSSQETTTTEETEGASHHGGSHDHKMDGGPAPEGIEDAEDPTYPVGTEVTLNTDHMPGMEGADARIVGAFKTYTYSVSYDPTDGGPRVTDHKWVVHEELAGVGADRLSDGDMAKILPDHMAGMEGAEATIDSSTDETVYMVDYDADGMTMKNHKWVVESEVQPKS